MSRKPRAALVVTCVAAGWILLFAMPAHADDCARLIREKGHKAILNNPQVIQDCLRTGQNWGWILAGAVGGTGIAVGLGGLTGTGTSERPPTAQEWLSKQKQLCDQVKQWRDTAKEVEEQIEKDKDNMQLVFSITQHAHAIVLDARKSWLKVRYSRQFAVEGGLWLAIASGGYWVASALQGLWAIPMAAGTEAAKDMLTASALNNLRAGLTATGGAAAMGAGTSSFLPNVDAALANLDREDGEIDRLHEEKMNQLREEKKIHEQQLERAKKGIEDAKTTVANLEAQMDKAGVIFAPCT